MEKIQLTALTYQEFKIFCSKKFNIPFHDISTDLIELIIYTANNKEPNSILIEDFMLKCDSDIKKLDQVQFLSKLILYEIYDR